MAISLRTSKQLAVSALLALAFVACKRANNEPPAPANAAAAPSGPEVSKPAPPTTPPPSASAEMATDVLETKEGNVRIVPIVHATLRLEFEQRVIYVDPYQADLIPNEPKADLVLITHAHPDHFDPPALAKVRKPETLIVAPAVVAQKVDGASALKNGEQHEEFGVLVQAVPMYNLKRGPSAGSLFHEKGVGNGYVLTLGGKRVYVAGDSECTPEMRALKDIDVAFVPMNLPYTMTPEEAADCVKAFRPKVVYPYHYRGSDTGAFKQALASTPSVEVRIRDWYPQGAH